MEEGNPFSITLCSDIEGAVLKFLGTGRFFLPQVFHGITVWVESDIDAHGCQRFELRGNGDPSAYYIVAQSAQHLADFERKT
jgi:hypothetical protein